MSGRPFLGKMDMPGGFKESALRLNKYVVLQNKWNEKHIQERANELAKKAESIWTYPTLTAAELAPYQAEEKKCRNIPWKHMMLMLLQECCLSLWISVL